MEQKNRRSFPTVIEIAVSKSDGIRGIVAALIHGIGNLPRLNEFEVGVAPNNTPTVDIQMRRAENFRRN